MIDNDNTMFVCAENITQSKIHIHLISDNTETRITTSYRKVIGNKSQLLLRFIESHPLNHEFGRRNP